MGSEPVVRDHVLGRQLECSAQRLKLASAQRVVLGDERRHQHVQQQHARLLLGAAVHLDSLFLTLCPAVKTVQAAPQHILLCMTSTRRC